MRKLHLKATISAIAGVCVTGVLFSYSAESDPTVVPVGAVTRTLIEHSDVPGTDLETRLYVITYPPGSKAPAHHHPVVGLGYIIEASARSAYDNDVSVVLKAGQSFHDLADVPHTVFENADPHRSLSFVIAYTVRKGAPVIEIP